MIGGIDEVDARQERGHIQQARAIEDLGLDPDIKFDRVCERSCRTSATSCGT